jgi:hypothetical protein
VRLLFGANQPKRRKLAARLIAQSEFLRGKSAAIEDALLAVNSDFETAHRKTLEEWRDLHERIGDEYRAHTDEIECYKLQTMYMYVGTIIEELQESSAGD